MIQNHRFKILIAGFDTMLVQEFTPPDVEYNQLQFGAAVNSPDAKVAGKKKVGDMTLKKLRLSGQADTFWRRLFESQSNTPFLNYSIPVIEIQELMPDGIAYAQRYIATNCFITKITHSGFKRSEDSELVMEELTLACTDFIAI